MRRHFTAISILIGISFLIPNSYCEEPQETLLYSEDFESGTSALWSLGDGWEVVHTAKGSVLRGRRHSFARILSPAWTDTKVRFLLKLDRDAALHANVRQGTDVSPRYFISFQRDQTSLSKQVGGNIFHNNLATGRGTGVGWHVVEIRVEGSAIRVSVEGKDVLNYTDPQPAMALGVSFECLSTEAVYIDDVAVWGLGEDETLTWIRTGGPLGGIGYDVRMNPLNPDLMYVTDAEAGVFISRDGGRNWEPSNRGITTRTGETGEIIPIFCLTIDPNRPDIVWAGTQGQRGVFRSVDGGISWERRDSGITESGITIRGFTVEPGDSDVVYAAGEISSWEWNGDPAHGIEFDRVKGAIYKTTDGGKIWQKVWEGDNLARYVWIDPRDTNVLYASTGIFDREAADSDPIRRIAGGVGVIKSTNGGRSWFAVNEGLGNLYVGTLYLHPRNPDVLLAGAGCVTYPEGSGVYLTTDGGRTWAQTLDTYAVASVEFSISDPTIAYAGNVHSVYRSTDGGITWKQTTPEGPGWWGPPGAAVGTPIDFQVDPRSPDRIFVNAYGGGNFLSEDGGRSWHTASRGYTGAQVRDIAVFPGNPRKIVAAARSGIFTSDDGGSHWIGRATGKFRTLDWHAVAVHPRDPNIVLSELTCPHLLVRSTDGALQWSRVDQTAEGMAWRTIEFAPSNPDVVYAGTTGFLSCGHFDFEKSAAGIRVSTDAGLSWRTANDEHTRDLSILKLAVDPHDPETVLAGSARRGLWETNDGGKNWRTVNPLGFGQRTITYAGFDPNREGAVFVGLKNGGLWCSIDGGRSWRRSGYGVDAEATVTDMAFSSSHNTIYLADLRSGVYRSTDGGDNWRPLNDGLLVRAVNALALSDDDGYLYAATEGQGVFRLDLE